MIAKLYLNLRVWTLLAAYAIIVASCQAGSPAYV